MSQLKVNSIIPVAGVPTGGGGGIIQTVQTIKTDTASFTIPTQGVYDYTGFSASITPTSSTSKILVSIMLNDGISSSISMAFILRCNGSDVLVGDQDGSNRPRVTASYHNEQPDFSVTKSLTVLHSPNSTSQQTYNLAFRTNSSSNRTHYINRSDGSSDNYTNFRGVSTIILQEVSA
jgi:hypothetical protein